MTARPADRGQAVALFCRHWLDGAIRPVGSSGASAAYRPCQELPSPPPRRPV